jgi:pantoate--beta-alanine ligase
MNVYRAETIEAVRAALQPRRHQTRIGFVPTMGALHAGHARLIETARRECGCVVVSIFVNPLQFDRADDLARYPRTLDEDLALCDALGVDVAFVPAAGEIYPVEPECTVDIGRLGEHLCGRGRPGHFRGVATVVLKLFAIVGPDTAYFGEKDAQQLAIVRRLVADFNLPISIAGVPTVREPDGLALSSRNRRLDACGRRQAVSLYAALQHARASIARGATDPHTIAAEAAAVIPGGENLRLEYLELVDPNTMQPVPRVDGPVLAAGALWVGDTRLIDNVMCDPARAGG